MPYAQAVTAAPPWVLACPVVTITRPPPAVVAVSLPPSAAIDVAWPRIRVTGAAPPPAPRVIHLAARPQGPVRLAFPAGHPLRHPLLYQQATAARG